MRETPLGIQSDRVPLTREQIKRSPENRPDSYLSPHHADGGWHTTPGCDNYTTEWEPLKDRVLLEVLPEKLPYEFIIRPENAAVEESWRRCIVLKVGKGKRVLPNEEVRQCCCAKVGDEVIIGQHDDWRSQDGRYVICQEEDIRVFLKRGQNGEADSRGA